MWPNITLVFLFICVFIWSIKHKYKLLVLISAIWLSTAIVSSFYSLNPYIVMSKELLLEPYLYLFGCFLICIYPLYAAEKLNISQKIIIYNSDIFNITILVLALVSYEPLLETLIRISTKGIDNLADVYISERAGTNFDSRGYFSFVGRFFFNIVDYFKFISVPLFLFYLTLPKRKIFITIGLACAVLNPVMFNLANGQRFLLVLTFYSFIFNFILLIPLFAKSVIKKILRYGLISLGMLLILFASISISRFGKNSDYDAAGYGGIYQVLRYFGESFYNFNTEGYWIKNHTWGRNSFTTYYSYFDPNNSYSIGKQNEITGIITNIFYTYIGNFVIDFGKVITTIIFLISSILLTSKVKRIRKYLKLGNLILISLYANIILFGTTYFVYQNGFIHMVWTLLYIIILNGCTTNRDGLRIVKKEYGTKRNS
ncbi:hypothetical protein BOVA604_1530 [Bacteroides ovatus]|uniref:O-antigen polymerase n=1 Tax=Bacteroides ovatus TaxID=28116 RepID=UPI0020A6EE56|nr:O-antigen polymerase [Bacteroides ovatus]CAG9892646.1 hypothetical protein BOVA604_1530 [Bacteroides ovatus]